MKQTSKQRFGEANGMYNKFHTEASKAKTSERMKEVWAARKAAGQTNHDGFVKGEEKAINAAYNNVEAAKAEAATVIATTTAETETIITTDPFSLLIKASKLKQQQRNNATTQLTQTKETVLRTINMTNV